MIISFYRIVFVALLLLLGSSLSAYSKGRDFEIVEGKDGYSLLLSTKIETLLNEYDPDFKIREMSSYSSDLLYFCKNKVKKYTIAIIGDFNGDKIDDLAVQGYTKSSNLVLAVISDQKTKKHKVHEIAKSRRIRRNKKINHGWNELLLKRTPGIINSAFEKEPLRLETDAFELVYFEEAAILYFYKDGKFHKYATAD